MIRPFASVWKNRVIVWQTTMNDIRSRYAGSFLGILWALLYPLLFFGAYIFLYVFVFNANFSILESSEYVILILCGLVPFIAFQDALTAGTPCVVNNASLMKNTMFPIELVPVKTVLGGQPSQLAGLGIAFIALIALGRFTPFALLVPLVWALQLMFNIGMVWFLASIDVFIRDLQNVMGIVSLLFMMMSPIAYPIELVPDFLQVFVKFNPLYYIIACYQDVLMNGRFPRMGVFLPFVAMALALYILGYLFFMKLKGVFADNV